MYQLLIKILDPFLLLFLVSALGVANLWRPIPATRLRLWLATVPFLALVFVCLPATAHFALGALEWRYPPCLRRPADVEAIVVLSGYLRPPDPKHGRFHPELWYDSADRCRLAAHLYHDGSPCLVVATGGRTEAESLGPSLAQAMKEFLVEQGVPARDVLVEEKSLSTYENASYTAPLLNQRGIRRIAVVTDATHLWRAEQCFRAQGFEVTPCGAHYRATEFTWSPLTFLPSPSAAADMNRVWHEWLGMAWYWMRGRV
jgi:uncharacterized SAM-binding protein YcdF (DUF218 family)